jgi:hypothetical protein
MPHVSFRAYPIVPGARRSMILGFTKGGAQQDDQTFVGVHPISSGMV